MSKIFVLFSMIFCHIADDYYLQGLLASAKQRKWWEENAPDKLYKNDYIMALLTHGASWAFMILLPIAVYQHFNITYLYIVAFLTNAIIHCIVDDLKANKLKINLITDQTIHTMQIFITFILWLIIRS